MTTPGWRLPGSWGTGGGSGPGCSASCSRTTYSPTGSDGRQGEGGRVDRPSPAELPGADPRAADFEALNARLLEDCRRRLGDRLRGHEETIGERIERDRAAFLSLPPAPYDACEKKPAQVSSLSLVRYRSNDYSVPTAYGHREVLVAATSTRWSSPAGQCAAEGVDHPRYLLRLAELELIDRERRTVERRIKEARGGGRRRGGCGDNAPPAAP